MHSYRQRQGLAKVPQVAKFLSVSVGKIYQLMDQAQLPSVRLGGTRRIPWPAVERLVRENTEDVTGPDSQLQVDPEQ